MEVRYLLVDIYCFTPQFKSTKKGRLGVLFNLTRLSSD